MQSGPVCRGTSQRAIHKSRFVLFSLYACCSVVRRCSSIILDTRATPDPRRPDADPDAHAHDLTHAPLTRVGPSAPRPTNSQVNVEGLSNVEKFLMGVELTANGGLGNALNRLRQVEQQPESPAL